MPTPPCAFLDTSTSRPCLRTTTGFVVRKWIGGLPPTPAPICSASRHAGINPYEFRPIAPAIHVKKEA
jgi:hypothetical protein